RPRDPVLRRARDADGSGPAEARPDLRDAPEVEPDQPLRRLRAHQARARDEPVPDAAVLPDDPEGPRGGGKTRRRGVLQNLLASDAAARGTGARRRDDPRVSGCVERLLLGEPAPPDA